MEHNGTERTILFIFPVKIVNGVAPLLLMSPSKSNFSIKE